ncbi:MAG: MopE-related protein [Polyangiaceae bacterium]
MLVILGACAKGTSITGGGGSGASTSDGGSSSSTGGSAGSENTGGDHPCTAEVCNGIDDDCNGVKDDPSVVDDNPCTTEFSGACSNGRTHCDNGTETCVPDVAPGSQPEICNGLDDDCNNLIDDTDVAMACWDQNPNAVNVESWDCNLGTCSIATCAAGTSDLDGQLANGCECDSDTQLGACDMNATTSVLVGTSLALSGVVEDPLGGDWITYSFEVPPVGQNYHPKIELTNNAGGLYTMDVMVDCMGNAAGCATTGGAVNDEVGINVAVWEQNFQGYDGLAGCCSDDTPRAGIVNVVIRRTATTGPTCSERYTVTASNL